MSAYHGIGTGDVLDRVAELLPVASDIPCSGPDVPCARWAEGTGNDSRVSPQRRNRLTHSRLASYTARRRRFAWGYVVSLGAERMRPAALEIVDCGTEPG